MLYIVGFGPGGYETMTVEAVRALEDRKRRIKGADAENAGGARQFSPAPG